MQCCDTVARKGMKTFSLARGRSGRYIHSTYSTVCSVRVGRTGYNNDDVIALAMAVRVFTWRTGLLLRSLRTSASKRGFTEARPEPEGEDPSANGIASIAAKLV